MVQFFLMVKSSIFGSNRCFPVLIISKYLLRVKYNLAYFLEFAQLVEIMVGQVEYCDTYDYSKSRRPEVASAEKKNIGHIKNIPNTPPYHDNGSGDGEIFE